MPTWWPRSKLRSMPSAHYTWEQSSQGRPSKCPGASPAVFF
jgi:hypothetical protein